MLFFQSLLSVFSFLRNSSQFRVFITLSHWLCTYMYM
jgi:hypothetical protein